MIMTHFWRWENEYRHEFYSELTRASDSYSLHDKPSLRHTFSDYSSSQPIFYRAFDFSIQNVWYQNEHLVENGLCKMQTVDIQLQFGFCEKSRVQFQFDFRQKIHEKFSVWFSSKNSKMKKNSNFRNSKRIQQLMSSWYLLKKFHSSK